MTSLRLGEPQEFEGDRAVVIRRWVVTLALPIIVAAVGYGYTGHEKRLEALENAPTSEKEVALIKQRVEAIERLIGKYEELRVERERQITELQTQQKQMQQTMQDMRVEVNTKLDRLLFGRMR